MSVESEGVTLKLQMYLQTWMPVSYGGLQFTVRKGPLWSREAKVARTESLHPLGSWFPFFCLLLWEEWLRVVNGMAQRCCLSYSQAMTGARQSHLLAIAGEQTERDLLSMKV